MSRIDELMAWLKGDEGEGEGSAAAPPSEPKTPATVVRQAATPAQMSASDAESQRLRDELQQEREKSRRLELERIHDRAASFAATAVKVEQRVFPAAQEALIALYEQLAVADTKLGAVTFSDGSTATYIGMLERFIAAQPKHALTAEQLIVDGQQLVVLGNTARTKPNDGAPTEDELEKLLAMTPGGRVTLASRKNGRN